MPKIPVHEGGGSGGYGIPDAPTSFRGGDNGLGEVGQNISKLGQIANQIGAVSAKLHAQEDDIEFTGTQTQYENRIKRTFQELGSDPGVINEPGKYSDIFAQRARDIQDEIRAGIKSPTVGVAFNRYLKGEYPKNLIEANNVGNKLQGKMQIAETDAQGDSISNLAADATPQKRQEYEDRYRNLVDGLFLKGHIDAVQHRNRITSFKTTVLEKNMDLLSRGGQPERERLFGNVTIGVYADVDPLKKAKYLEQAEKTQIREDNLKNKRVKEAADMIENHYYSLANFGQLPASEEESLGNGTNPLIDAQKAQAIINRNRNPLFGGSDAPVRAIESEMNATPGGITKEKVENAKAQLRELMKESGATKEIDEALRRIQSRHGEARSLEAQETNAAIRYAEQTVKSQTKNSMIPRLNTRARNQAIIDTAEINKRILDGKVRDQAGAAKIIEEVLKRKPGTKPVMPEEDSIINKLLER